MTTLDYAALIASFPTNASGDITALNMRNFVDSVELKYDNWNIVKSGQPEGAAFPDPVAGVIDLPVNSIWVINGSVNIFGTLNFLGNNQIISLSGSFSINAIILDFSLGAATLMRVGNSSSATVKGVLLQITNNSQTMMDIQNGASVIIFEQCGFLLFDGAWGTVTSVTKFIMLDCFSSSGAGSSSLTFLGTTISVVIEGHLTGTGFLGTDANIFDFTTATAINSLRVEACTPNLTTAPSFIRATDSTVLAGIFVNSTVLGTPFGVFVIGVDNFSINSTFSGNIGIPNTKVIGGLAMSKNASVTTSPAASTFTPIIGNTQDLITFGTCRFIRNAALQLQYKGKEQFVGVATMAVSYRRAVLSAAQQFTVCLFKNGVPISVPFPMSMTSIVRTSAVLATATMSAAFALQNGMTVVISGAVQSAYNGTFVIGGVAGLTFTYPLATDPVVNATGILIAQLPVEVVIPQTATDQLYSSTLTIPVVLNTNDILRAQIRSDGGSVNSVVDTVFLNVE